jgi:hypothetical protein
MERTAPGTAVMTSTSTAPMESQTATQRATRRSATVGAIAGVSFAVLLFVGTAGLNVPKQASDEELVAWWSKSSNQLAAVVGMFAWAFAGLCFLVFLVQLRSRLAAAGGRAETVATAWAAGLVFVATTFQAAADRGVIGMAVRFRDEPLPGVDTLRYTPQHSYTSFGVFAMLAAALTIAMVSWLILQTGVFGRALAWLGIVVVALMLVAEAALVGQYAIPALLLWAIATSVALWRAPRDGAVPAAGPDRTVTVG